MVDQDKIKPFKIVIDAGNGMAGKIIPPLFSHLRCEVIPMFFELDGSFPHHLASPIETENIAPSRERVLGERADLGAAFDGDADRMFLLGLSRIGEKEATKSLDNCFCGFILN